jgi:hypothetical protein
MPEQTMTTGSSLASMYIMTHRQRLEQSLQMAQFELQSKQARLQYLQGYEKNLTDYIEKVNSGSTMDDKTYDRWMNAVKLEADTRAKANDDRARIDEKVEASYLVPQGATGSINMQARDAALNLTTGKLPTSQIKAVTGYTPGTPGAMSAGIALYQQMQNEAAANGTITQFNAQKTAIANEISNTFGLQQLGGTAVLQNPKAWETAKANEKDRQMKEYGAPQLTQTQIADVYKASGRSKTGERLDAQGNVIPASVTTTTTTGTPAGKTQNQQEIEAMFMQRLKETQEERLKLEKEIAQGTSAEALYDRQREIYDAKYGNTREKRRTDKQYDKMFKDADPTQMFYLESMIASKDLPSVYGLNKDKASNEQKAAESLMNTIINNKGTGKPLDVAALAGQLAEGDTEAQKRIIGMAFKGVQSYVAATQPQQEVKDKQNAKKIADEYGQVAGEIRADVEVKKEKLANMDDPTQPSDTGSQVTPTMDLFTERTTVETPVIPRGKQETTPPEQLDTLTGGTEEIPPTIQTFETNYGFTVTATRDPQSGKVIKYEYKPKSGTRGNPMTFTPGEAGWEDAVKEWDELSGALPE